MEDNVTREFSVHERTGFVPGTGWVWENRKNADIPYSAYSYYVVIGAWNFRRIRDRFCFQNMFSEIIVKDPRK